MKQLEKKIIITYRWWELEENGAIQSIHLDRLDNIAKDFISKQIILGYTSGELPTQKYASFDAMYTGFWEMKIETV